MPEKFRKIFRKPLWHTNNVRNLSRVNKWEEKLVSRTSAFSISVEKFFLRKNTTRKIFFAKKQGKMTKLVNYQYYIAIYRCFAKGDENYIIVREARAR